MNEKFVIILGTTWGNVDWHIPLVVRYVKNYIFYDNGVNLETVYRILHSRCIPAIGFYKSPDLENEKIVYLKIKGIKEEGNEILFETEAIAPSSNVTGQQFGELIRTRFQLPGNNLVFLLNKEKVFEILEIAKEESIPNEWEELIYLRSIYTPWENYIGKYFLDLIESSLSNIAFEQRCYELLKAIGFTVKQYGYTVHGEYPDGEIFLNNDIVIVYDCKNIPNFTLKTEYNRQLATYVENTRIIYPHREVYGAFIVKSISSENIFSHAHFSIFPVEFLVYLLYKKIVSGKEFDIAPFRKIVKKKLPLTRNLIDIEWKLLTT